MGMPYSKQINAAFDQVTPLVGEGYKVLETIKNISVLLSWIQVLTVVLLGSIAGLLLALLITINPDLDDERRQLVTPVVRWLCARVLAHFDFVARHPWVAVCGYLSVVVGVLFVAFCFIEWIDPHLELRGGGRSEGKNGENAQDGIKGGSSDSNSRPSSTKASDESDGAEE
ncbi:hypothetical protein PspLS_09801 [Pyricularia sp. CBS 133598]|nr:hypothetical protein PspLS_09801 [Pyricularia sp. CBS 133598]